MKVNLIEWISLQLELENVVPHDSENDFFLLFDEIIKRNKQLQLNWSE